MSHDAKSHAGIASSIVVNVSGGVPSQTSVTLPGDQRLVFVNLDDTDYLVELWNHANKEHVVVCPVLAANGSLTFSADLDDLKPGSKCFYNIESIESARRKRDDPFDGGGHVIIIGK